MFTRRTLVIAGLLVVLSVPTLAQTTAPAPPPAAHTTPQVSAQDKQIVQALDVQRTGYAIAIAALQEKLDAVNAELGRTVQRLQAAHPGYDLAQGLVYVKKPEPAKAPEKREPPK